MTPGAIAFVVTFAGVAVASAAGALLFRHRLGSFACGAGPMIAGFGGGAAVLAAFALYEPRHEGEAIGLVLPTLAATGVVVTTVWIARALRMLAASRRAVSAWVRHGVQLDPARWQMPAVLVDTGAPIVAVAGILRHSLIIDRSVLQHCSENELDAIAEHERAHVARRDNLRRLLVTACSGPSSARTATWRLSAELAADSWAASSPDRGVALASALLKIARTGARSPFDRLALSAIDDAAPLEARVRRLLDEQPRPAAASAHPRRRWLLAGLLMAPVLLRIVHQGVEAAVRHLP